MRPMDIKFSRNKTPVEIGNTDAEGRLILADTLSYAQEGKINPDLIIDFATLTGAARVALGTEVPVFFSNNENISKKLLDNSIKMVDPVWQLPLLLHTKGSFILKMELLIVQVFLVQVVQSLQHYF